MFSLVDAEALVKMSTGKAPKINVWTSGSDNSDPNSYANSIAGIMKMIPPMLSTIHDQTGIKVSDKIISIPKTKE